MYQYFLLLSNISFWIHYPFISWWTFGFFSLLLGINTAVNIFVQGFRMTIYFISLGCIPGSGIALCLAFWEIARLFYSVTVPFDIPNRSVWVLALLFFFFYLSHPSGCFGVSWFWFPFLWWLVMLNIFLWIHSIKPFVYLLWRTVYSGTLPTLKSDCLFTIELCLLYIPDKSPESNKWFTNIFSFCVHIVHILHGVLWSTRF